MHRVTADDPNAAPPNPAPVTVRLPAGPTVHILQTGWVSVKRPHRAFGGVDALALPAILASNAWTPWLPVTATVIEHPEGIVVVDTGETARIAEPDYTACDAITGWFYGANLRFAVRRQDEIDPQMERIGLDPRDVASVVMTHLHSDHVGGMGHFPNARFLVSRADARGHAGALMCMLPAEARRVAVEHDGPAAGAFAGSHAVTGDGFVRIVPTPGHSRGHQSVLLGDDARSWLVAGDAAFDTGQIERGEVAASRRIAMPPSAHSRCSASSASATAPPSCRPTIRARLRASRRRTRRHPCAGCAVLHARARSPSVRLVL